MDLANDTVDQDTEAKMTMLINKMFKQRESGDGISFEQFKGILNEYEHELNEAKLGLNIDGKQSDVVDDKQSDVIDGKQSDVIDNKQSDVV